MVANCLHAVTLAIALGTVAMSADAAPPSAPGALRAEVYSDTAAELFWQRSSDTDGRVVGYHVRCDGELLETVSVRPAPSLTARA